MTTTATSIHKAMVFTAVAGMLTFGAGTTLTMKFQYATYSLGSTGEEKFFDKSLFVTFSMFLGMTTVLAPYHMLKGRSGEKVTSQVVSDSASDGTDERTKKDASESASTGSRGSSSNGVSEFAAFMYIGVPAMLDLVVSIMLIRSLLFIPASIYSMLRGSLIVFTALLSVAVLGRKLHCGRWIGVLLCTVGISVAGLANLLNSGLDEASDDLGEKSGHALLGMSMVIVAEVVQACQVVAQEKLLKDLQLPPMKVVGYSGVWGTVVFIVAVFPACWFIPGSDNGHLEDVFDTASMLNNNGTLFASVMVIVFFFAGYNLSSMSVTNHLSAVHRTMFEASRTAVIWVVSLGVHYLIDSDLAFGEALTIYSPLQLLGFLMLFAGQLLYGGVLNMPCAFSRAGDEVAADDEEVNGKIAREMSRLTEFSR